jgi:hypothetical protein
LETEPEFYSRQLKRHPACKVEVYGLVSIYNQQDDSEQNMRGLMDSITIAQEIGDRFNLPDEAQADIRLGLDALLRHGIVNEKTAPSYAKVLADRMVKMSYLAESTEIAELKAALEDGAKTLLKLK